MHVDYHFVYFLYTLNPQSLRAIVLAQAKQAGVIKNLDADAQRFIQSLEIDSFFN
jgi:hypothetical protein